MPSRKIRKQRRRGRPAHLNLDSLQSVTTNNLDQQVKLALMQEAGAHALSLSLYVALVLTGLTAHERDAACIRGFNTRGADEPAAEPVAAAR